MLNASFNTRYRRTFFINVLPQNISRPDFDSKHLFMQDHRSFRSDCYPDLFLKPDWLIFFWQQFLPLKVIFSYYPGAKSDLYILQTKQLPYRVCFESCSKKRLTRSLQISTPQYMNWDKWLTCVSLDITIISWSFVLLFPFLRASEFKFQKE